MSRKIYQVLNKVYAGMMFTSFFAGAIPLLPMLISLFVGGEIGPKIYEFFFSDYYPWVIALGSVSILVGLVAMYVGKIEDFSLKSLKKEDEEAEEK